MNNEDKFEQWATSDTMCDARQADYDYAGEVPVDEDVADWYKQKRKGAIRIG